MSCPEYRYKIKRLQPGAFAILRRSLSVAQGRVIGRIITSNHLESISGFHAVGFRDLLSLSYPSVLPFGPMMTHGEESRSQLQGLQKTGHLRLAYQITEVTPTTEQRII